LEIGQLLIISMLLPLLLATAIIAGFGILVMSLEANSALGQWILPSSELKNAYKQGYHESNVTMDEVKQRK
jgi:Ni/Fe-hydrogenase subunit HybB-like protein